MSPDKDLIMWLYDTQSQAGKRCMNSAFLRYHTVRCCFILGLHPVRIFYFYLFIIYRWRCTATPVWLWDTSCWLPLTFLYAGREYIQVLYRWRLLKNKDTVRKVLTEGFNVHIVLIFIHFPVHWSYTYENSRHVRQPCCWMTDMLRWLISLQTSSLF